MSKLAANWTMTHASIGSNYVLTCENDKFIEKKMSVKVPCSGKVMTDDLYVAVEAKQGSINLTGNDISATLSLDYSTNVVSISGGTATITPVITEGWIASGEPKTIGAIGSYTILIDTSTNTFYPKSSPRNYSPANGKYFKNVSVAGVSTDRSHTNLCLSSMTYHNNQDTEVIKLYHDQILIVLSEDNQGFSADYIRFRHQYDNSLTYQGDSDSSWDVVVSKIDDAPIEDGSCMYGEYNNNGTWTWKIYSRHKDKTINFAVTSDNYCTVNIRAKDNGQIIGVYDLNLIYVD